MQILWQEGKRVMASDLSRGRHDQASCILNSRVGGGREERAKRAGGITGRCTVIEVIDDKAKL